LLKKPFLTTKYTNFHERGEQKANSKAVFVYFRAFRGWKVISLRSLRSFAAKYSGCTLAVPGAFVVKYLPHKKQKGKQPC